MRAEKFADVYMIRRADLSNIEEKPMDRPPKAATTKQMSKKKGGKR